MEISLSLRSLRRSIAGLSLLALLASMSFAGVAKAQTFSDVDPDDWYYEYVESLVDLGVVEGYDDGTFGPGDTLNRAQAAKIMVLAFAGEGELDYDYDAGFPDVDSDAWYAVYVNTAQKLGIVEGYEDGTFGPGDEVNRAAFAKMVVNAAGLETDTTDAPHFSDVDDSAWYYNYIETAYNNTVIDGYSDGTFKPADDVDRAAACKMVYQGQNPELRYDTGDDDTGDDDTGDDDTGDDDTATEGTLTVEMGDEIAGISLPKGATSVEMLNVIFTADGGDVELDTVVLHRKGVGATTDYSYVYLYEGDVRLTTGRSIASDTNEVTFGSLNKTIEDGDALTLTVVVDTYASATTGDENILELIDVDSVESDAIEVTGTFPIESGTFTIAGSSSGAITMSKNGSVPNPTIGEAESEIAEFSLAASSAEDLALTRVTLTVKGTVTEGTLTNLKLLQGSDIIATAESVEDELITFVINGNYNCGSYTYSDNGYCIGKGNTKVFNVTGDVGVVADPNETIYVYLDESTDLGTTGLVYGYGASVTYSAYDNAAADGTDASWSTIQGGQVTLSQDGPSATDLAINAKDVILEKFTVTAQRDIEFRKLTVTAAATGSGLVDTVVRNFSDFKIVELDENDEVIDSLMGPQETTLSGSDTSQSLVFTDYWTMAAGETKTIAITCDIANYASLADSTITTTLAAVSTTEGILDTDTNEYVTDIVPASAIAGNAMTVKAASLTLALATMPISDTFVKGTTGVNLATFTLSAGGAMDVTVTQIDLSGYIDEGEGDADYYKGEDNSIDMRDLVPTVWLEDSEGNQIGTDESFSANTTGGEATFSSLSWTIGAGETETLKVYGDLSASAPFNSSTDRVCVDILDGDIVSEDEEDNSVDASGDAPNGGTATTATPTVAMTVTGGGTLTIAENTSDPMEEQVVATGETDVLLAKFKATAADEDFKITKMTLTATGAVAGVSAVTYVDASYTALLDNLSTLTIKYPTDVDDPDTLDGEKTVAVSGTKVLFDSLEFYVPKDDSAYFEVYADLAGHTNDGLGGADSDDSLRIIIDNGDLNGNNADFVATGQGSGTGYVESELSNVTSSYSTYVYRTLPTVANASSLGSSLLPGEQEVYRFTVSADDNYDTILYYMTLDLTQTGLVTGNSATSSLSKDADANTTWQVGVCGGTGYYGSSAVIDTTRSAFQVKEYGQSTVLGSGCYDAHNGLVKIQLSWSGSSRTSGVLIGKNATKTYSIFATVVEDANTATTSSLSMRIHQDTTYRAAASMLGLVGINNTNLAATGLVWSDYGIQSGTHGENTAEWMTGYKVPGMPVSYVTLS